MRTFIFDYFYRGELAQISIKASTHFEALERMRALTTTYHYNSELVVSRRWFPWSRT